MVHKKQTELTFHKTDTGQKKEGQNKMTEQSEHEFMKEVELFVTGVIVEMDQRIPEMVKKLTLNTTAGNISHKPKSVKEEYRNGFLVKSQAPSYFADLPENLKQIAQEVSERGKCKVVGSYSVWNTEKDGQAITYRFIQGNTMMATWKLQKEQVPTQRVY